MSRFFKKNIYKEIDFENILFDSKNVSNMDAQQLQGVIERPITKWALFVIAISFGILTLAFSVRLYQIQIVSGEDLYNSAEHNSKKYQLLFNKRGVIYDTNGVELAWNMYDEDLDFAKRKYTSTPGFSHLLGYVTYPQKDTNGKYFQAEYQGVSGIEYAYNDLLNGQLGYKEVRVNTLGKIISDSVIQESIGGLNIRLTVDAILQERLQRELARFVDEQKFEGAAGVIMDVETGAILVLTNVPEYDSNVLADGKDRAAIAGYNTNSQKPFLNRVLGGSYAPGSVVKVFIAAGILDRNLVNPNYKLKTTGTLIVPNKYGGASTYFRDVFNNGSINIKEALAKSSNIYFFTFGGGFGTHKGLGIYGMKEYLNEFGLGEKTGITEFRELAGFVPDPEWKLATFNEKWLLGDTYYTAIGQYSFLATPLQMVTGVGAIATDGVLMRPQLVQNVDGKVIPDIRRVIDISEEDFDVVQQGMRMVVTHPKGTAGSLNLPYVKVAAKTGTAERGVNRSKWNSWAIGYWPYDKPKYAFVVMAENGPAGNRLGVSITMSRMFNDMFTDGITQYFD